MRSESIRGLRAIELNHQVAGSFFAPRNRRQFNLDTPNILVFLDILRDLVDDLANRVFVACGGAVGVAENLAHDAANIDRIIRIYRDILRRIEQHAVDKFGQTRHAFGLILLLFRFIFLPSWSYAAARSAKISGKSRGLPTRSSTSLS